MEVTSSIDAAMVNPNISAKFFNQEKLTRGSGPHYNAFNVEHNIEYVTIDDIVT